MQENFVKKSLYLTSFFKLFFVISLCLLIYYIFKIDIQNILIWLGIFLMTFKLIIFPINLKENIFSKKIDIDYINNSNYKKLKLVSDIGLLISISGILFGIFS